MSVIVTLNINWETVGVIASIFIGCIGVLYGLYSDLSRKNANRELERYKIELSNSKYKVELFVDEEFMYIKKLSAISSELENSLMNIHSRLTLGLNSLSPSDIDDLKAEGKQLSKRIMDFIMLCSESAPFIPVETLKNFRLYHTSSLDLLGKITVWLCERKEYNFDKNENILMKLMELRSQTLTDYRNNFGK